VKVWRKNQVSPASGTQYSVTLRKDFGYIPYVLQNVKRNNSVETVSGKRDALREANAEFSFYLVLGCKSGSCLDHGWENIDTANSPDSIASCPCHSFPSAITPEVKHLQIGERKSKTEVIVNGIPLFLLIRILGFLIGGGRVGTNTLSQPRSLKTGVCRAQQH
jgi:hypothetical protein